MEFPIVPIVNEVRGHNARAAAQPTEQQVPLNGQGIVGNSVRAARLCERDEPAGEETQAPVVVAHELGLQPQQHHGGVRCGEHR